ncbi:hypothetical protein E2C01_088394 [Portunus trituberculatus]|uniref:Uncharacterized protein n=1 Tax=Portunus trituberculatus TaxID=210409 RepID=A0A5B7J945_PORTR|nr:hypothetical protein [Portunus trituberculatus]
MDLERQQGGAGRVGGGAGGTLRRRSCQNRFPAKL